MSVNVEVLCELIRLKPVSSDIAAVNRAEDRMKEYLESEGLFCTMEEIEGRHVLFAATEPGKVPDYLLNAHIDVVPGEDELFVPRIENGTLYARGADDCLGSCMVAAETLIALKGKVSCGAIFTADEEIGGRTTAGMVKLGYGAKKSILVIDAKYDKLAYCQKGIIAVELIARSKTGGGHASYPWEFDNPIERLAEGFVRLRSSWSNPTREAQWADSMTPCVFRAGRVHNQIPDSASMTLNIRYVNAEDREKILARIKETTACDEVRLLEDCIPAYTDLEAPEVKRLLAVMRKHFGREIPLAHMNGATDARHFMTLNVPVAMIGVEGSGEHSPREYVRLDSLTFVSEYLQDYLQG